MCRGPEGCYTDEACAWHRILFFRRANKNMPGPFAQTQNPLIVMCGSMSQYPYMLELQTRLKQLDIQCIVPELETERHAAMSAKEFSKFKRLASERYFRKIRRRNVWAVLIVNMPRKRRPNYIGANTFAEIAIAVNAKKRVYLLNDLYPPFGDELSAWGAIPLNGILTTLISDYQTAIDAASSQLDFHLSGTSPTFL